MYIDDELDETLFESHYCCSDSNSDFLYNCITCIVVLSTVCIGMLLFVIVSN